MRTRLAALIALMLVGWAASAQGVIIVDAVETGGDVVFTGSGSLDLSTWSYESTVLGLGAFLADGGLIVGPAVSMDMDRYGVPLLFSGPLDFGPGTTLQFADSGSGDLFGINFEDEPTLLFIQTGYVSGDPLSGSSTYSGESFESLGMAIGSYHWSWGTGPSADSFTLNIIPEPSSAILTAIGLIGLASRSRRQRR